MFDIIKKFSILTVKLSLIELITLIFINLNIIIMKKILITGASGF